MGNHVLSGVKGFVKRGGEIFLVKPESINVVSGWNDRIDFSGEEELMKVIKDSGVPGTLTVRKTKAGTLELVDGERRLRAVLRLKKEGMGPDFVPVVVAPKNSNEIDLYVKSVVLNNGKPLTPSEEASSYKRLQAYGCDIPTIALKTGRSQSHIRNRLELSGAIPAVKTAVDNGEITIQSAQEIVRNSDGKVVAQTQALQKKKAVPKRTRQKRLTLFFKKGAVQSKGIKNQTCDPLVSIIQADGFQEKVRKAGFDPATIKISIAKE